MEKQEIINELIQYIRKNSPTAKNVDEIPLDARLFDLQILDSFAIVEMVAFIENHWSIQISDAEITNEFFKGLDTIADIIHSKLLPNVDSSVLRKVG